MQLGDVLALHLGDPHLADRGADEELYRPAVFPWVLGLQWVGTYSSRKRLPSSVMTGSVFRFASASRGSTPVFAWARISSAATLASSGVMGPCWPMVNPAQLAAHPGLEDVVLPARLPDPDAEAG